MQQTYSVCFYSNIDCGLLCVFIGKWIPAFFVAVFFIGLHMQALRALACDIGESLGTFSGISQQDLFAVAEQSEDWLMAWDTTEETHDYNSVRPMTLVGVFTSGSRFR